MTDALPPITVWLRRKMQADTTLTRRKIARYAHVSPDTIKNIYDGTVARPETETLEKMALYFGVAADELKALAGYVSRPPSTVLPELIGIPIEQVIARLTEEEQRAVTNMQTLPVRPETRDWAIRLVASDMIRARRRE